MPAGARLLGVEHVVPEGARQASGKLTDVNMMVIAGGRERTEAEYRRLFAAHGFRPTRVVPTRGRRVWDRGLAGLKASISSRRSNPDYSRRLSEASQLAAGVTVRSLLSWVAVWVRSAAIHQGQRRCVDHLTNS